MFAGGFPLNVGLGHLAHQQTAARGGEWRWRAQGGETTKPSPPAQDPAEADAWEVDVEALVTQIGLGFVIFFTSLSGGGFDARHMVSLPGAKTGARPPPTTYDMRGLGGVSKKRCEKTNVDGMVNDSIGELIFPVQCRCSIESVLF